ncbi:MAG: DUF4476 domain-containing protein [Bacteroidales bacterium]|nr:DUF4476 domain-containing protein [Bacteroidales bacterium]
MKKLMMTFALMSLALSLAASHPNPSELIISLHDGAAFNITVGDRSYDHQRTSYTISDLRPGRHFVRIVRYDRFFNGRVYVLGASRVVFADYVRVPARSRIVGRIDHRGRFVEVERMALRYAPAPPPAHYPPAHHPGSYRVAMSPQAFAGLKATLANTRFESSRLDIAKHAVSRNNLSAIQVKEMMDMFSFESNRLELAKYAYGHTIDPQNYFLVHRAFRFSSSTRELNRFIAANY